MSDNLELYYRFHSKIYDATRWSFLFGRDGIIQKASSHITPKNILEIGCGTGKNLPALHNAFPQARITGLDLSRDMLDIARKKTAHASECIFLRRELYDSPLSSKNEDPFDLILFSYSLTMINPGFDNVIRCAGRDLSENGLIAVVDFNNSHVPMFKSWMGINQVRMDGHLAPELKKNFTTVLHEEKKAYLGLWSYFYYLGRT